MLGKKNDDSESISCGETGIEGQWSGSLQLGGVCTREMLIPKLL